MDITCIRIKSPEYVSSAEFNDCGPTDRDDS